MIVLSEKGYNALAGQITGTVDMLIKDGHFFAYKHRIDEDRPYAHVTDSNPQVAFQDFFLEIHWITGNDLHLYPTYATKAEIMKAIFPEFIPGCMDPDYLAWREFLVLSLPDPSTQP